MLFSFYDAFKDMPVFNFFTKWTISEEIENMMTARKKIIQKHYKPV